MELRQLKYFSQVAEVLNFSAAARVLCITQSTLSQQIKQLENELNVQLFERDSHNVRLTEVGREFLPFVAQTLRCADTCIERINEIQHLHSGTLSIGVTYSFSPMLTDTIIRFTKLYPGIKLKVYYQEMLTLMNQLEHHKLDFLLCFKPLCDYPHIESTPLFDTRLCAVVSRHHPLAQKSKITLSELSKWTLAMPVYGMQARNIFDELASQSGLHFDIRAEVTMIHVLLGMIRGTQLATVLAEAITINEKELSVIPIEEAMTMKGCVHTLKGTYRKDSAKKFIEMLKENNAVRQMLKDL